MKKQLDPDEIDALNTWERSGAHVVGIIKRILTEHIQYLESIKNIDPKSNMGLQTLANQNACREVESIRDMIFREGNLQKRSDSPVKKVSQYR